MCTAAHRGYAEPHTRLRDRGHGNTCVCISENWDLLGRYWAKHLGTVPCTHQNPKAKLLSLCFFLGVRDVSSKLQAVDLAQLQAVVVSQLQDVDHMSLKPKVPS